MIEGPSLSIATVRAHYREAARVMMRKAPDALSRFVCVQYRDHEGWHVEHTSDRGVLRFAADAYGIPSERLRTLRTAYLTADRPADVLIVVVLDIGKIGADRIPIAALD